MLEMLYQELITKAPADASPQELFDQVMKVAKLLGFEYCAFGIRLPYPLSTSRIEIFNNYPGLWSERYAREGYLARDPSVAHGRSCTSARMWDDQLFESTPALWSEARSMGLRHGWFKSTHETSGMGSMLTLARSSEVITPAELRVHEKTMSMLVHMAHQALTKALMPMELPTAQSQLTSREIEVLRWTADGKSSSEIADILTISDNTVNFHIKNAVRKLRTNNKTAATVRAAVLGLLAV